MILLVDDAKEGGWADIVARNAKAANLILKQLKDSISELHIDFDLGSSSAMNGLEILKFALENKFLPNIIWVVSFNTPGREAMENFLKDNGYVQKGNRFEKGR